MITRGVVNLPLRPKDMLRSNVKIITSFTKRVTFVKDVIALIITTVKNGWNVTDAKFVHLCKKILESPYSDINGQVRPKWEDGTPAHTRKIFGYVENYDLSTGHFPIMTLRKINWKAAIDEILWIYQRATSDLSKLNSHIWDSWDVGDGTIGRAYGYQIGIRSPHHRAYPQDLSALVNISDVRDGWVYLNQMEAVLYDLEHTPLSRSIMTTTYNPQDLTKMGLRPCAWNMIYNVTQDEESGEMFLNGILNQRSQDTITANNWNVVQYAALLIIVAHFVGMTPGTFMHVITDAHIYDRHEDIARELIDRYDHTVAREVDDDGRMLPGYQTLTINPDCKSFWDLKVDDLNVTGYYPDTTKYKIPVAV